MDQKDRKKTYQKLYYQKNKEHFLKLAKEYNIKNSEHIKLKNKEYYQKNKERIKKWAREYQRKEIPKLKHRILSNKRYARYRDEMFKVLGGGICKRCGFSDKRALAIDHKDNDGYSERKRIRSIAQLRKKVLEEPHRYQILCFNCNQIKRYENDRK